MAEPSGGGRYKSRITSGQTAAGTLAVWAAAGLMLAGAYSVAQWQFLRTEVPTKPSRYTPIRIGED